MQETRLSMTKGDTFAFEVEIEGLEEELTKASFTCKAFPSDETAVFQKTLANGITKVSTGVYRVRVAPEDTKDVALGEYYYDLELVLGEDVFTVLKGKLSIEYEVTE